MVIARDNNCQLLYKIINGWHRLFYAQVFMVMHVRTLVCVYFGDVTLSCVCIEQQ